MTDFTLLILSDLHMHHGDTEGGVPSYLSSRPSLDSTTRNPMNGIPDLLRQANIHPDWILCPGDLGDQCNELAQSQAWEALQRLKRKTHARRVIGTVGNHDIYSRRDDASKRPNDFLLALNPTFPTTPRQIADKYWRHNFCYLRDDNADLNLLIINSCALHGVAPAKGHDDEYKRGRITLDTITRINETVGMHLKGRNLLLLHHHIRQHPWLTNEISHMENGPALLEALKGTGRQWLVVHGHQHLPNISYSEGGAIAPIVFSAGSIAAQTTVVHGKHARNQLYCLRFDLGTPPSGELRGRIQTWDWYPYIGWQLASRDSGLPHSCGFGYRGPINALCDRILQATGSTPHSNIHWSDLANTIPETNFLIPDDLELLIQHLQQRGAVVHYDRWGLPSLVAARRVA